MTPRQLYADLIRQGYSPERARERAGLPPLVRPRPLRPHDPVEVVAWKPQPGDGWVPGGKRPAWASDEAIQVEIDVAAAGEPVRASEEEPPRAPQPAPAAPLPPVQPPPVPEAARPPGAPPEASRTWAGAA